MQPSQSLATAEAQEFLQPVFITVQRLWCSYARRNSSVLSWMWLTGPSPRPALYSNEGHLRRTTSFIIKENKFYVHCDINKGDFQQKCLFLLQNRMNQSSCKHNYWNKGCLGIRERLASHNLWRNIILVFFARLDLIIHWNGSPTGRNVVLCSCQIFKKWPTRTVFVVYR